MRFAFVGLSIVTVVSMICAATYAVGPGRTYTTLQDVADILRGGDVVNVDGNATYPANVYLDNSGTAAARITVNGIKPAEGTSPVITGSGAYGISISGDYVTLQGFEIKGGPKGIGVFGDNIIIRGCVVHGCNHGIVGYGSGTGSVTVEYSELYGNGITTGGATQHQIYMATDEIAHPGATFRLQFCYIHNGSEGDNVKSRAEKNQIYYNWIELAGTIGHGLGLFAPDPDDNDRVTVATAREDAEVVGNVIIQDHNACARIGGDTPGYPTNGRYRFVNNTFILTGTTGDVVRTFNTIQTLEMYNNVVFATTTGTKRVVNDNDGTWLSAPRPLIGSNNWIFSGATMIPAEFTGTITGTGSPFVAASAKNYTPALNSGLINSAVASTPTISAYPFPAPLSAPAFVPPRGGAIETGEVRTLSGTMDIGAFESAPSAVREFLSGAQKNKALSPSRYALDGRQVLATKVRKPALFAVWADGASGPALSGR